MTEPSTWVRMTQEDPAHSAAYIQRFRDLAARWLVGDLAELDLPARGIAEPFDAIVCAGNVMTFLAPSTRGAVLRRLRAHIAPDGRAAIGFGAGRGYEFAEFLSDVAGAGWEPDLLLSTWDLRPFTPDAD